jgi:hypothetical protein
VQLLRIAAAFLFTFAALAGFDLGIHWDVDTVLGLIASGLVLLTLSWLDPPAPPSR